ncbi:hypothetical protein Hdeb2414_s0008g00270581 [Helianthus debilis subsp. tardiflorus]
MCLAFHETDCVHYKLVCIRTLKAAKDLLQVQVYSCDTGEWKICPVTFHSRWFFFQQGVYWNGAIHWPPSYFNHLYFKIEDEQLQTLPLPLEMAASTSLRTTMYFGESRGHLHLIVDDYPRTRSIVRVLEMLGDHSGWFVKYQLQLPELWAAFPEMSVSPFDFEVVDVVRGEKEEDTFMVLIIPWKFIRYNVHDKSFKQLYDITNHANESAHRYTAALCHGVSFRPPCGVPNSPGTSQSIPLLCVGHWFRPALDSSGERRQLSTSGAFVVCTTRHVHLFIDTDSVP